MISGQDSIISELKLRLKLLEKQGDKPAGYMEEKLLLWLVTETIIQSDNRLELIHNVLERISVILDIDYASCCQYRKDKVTAIAQYYGSAEKDANPCNFISGSKIFSDLGESPVIIDSGNFNDYHIYIPEKVQNIPSVIGIFPFQSLFIPFGVFVFFASQQDFNKLFSLRLVIHRLILMAVEKTEKLSLMDELKNLNSTFENRVREQTDKFRDNIKKLKTEIKERTGITQPQKEAADSETSGQTMSILKDIGIEVRTPMNGILGFVEILRDKSIPENDRNNYIDIIKSCAKSILKIVDDSKNYSYVNSSQFNAKPEEFNITTFLTALYDKFKKDELYKQREDVDIKLNINVNSSTNIISDKQLTEQIMNNLVGNAIKYTASGFIEFGCYLQKNQKNLDELVLFVKDTGIGIDKTIRNDVFEPFFKVEHDISKLYGGMGLGLTIAKKLTERLHGRIWFESKTNEGTVFYVALPNPIPVKEEDIAVNSGEMAGTSLNWKDKTFLIVEDDEMSYIFLKEVLKATNVSILHANTGNKAIEKKKSNKRIDLVLMDIKLPDISGYEATSSIKKIRNIPVIAQTAYAMADDQKKSLEVGCDDYISKPINRKKLLHSIESILDKTNPN